ncbi:MAG: helix-turn-helix transcriptional regulator [Bacilli bacterium]|jgi:transcriptional regulator with XRE-family HTH domain|nr:helix-turn-helix transcriptional regulator [Bacilli bacterium]MDY0064273.1 helix-turn-helix transcriptional regulator [Bacilli bacterium]
MPEIIDNNKVGSLIKELLKEKGMTQDDLAKALNVSKSAVSQNLNGKSSFDIQNLIAISKLFDIPIEKLLVQKSDNFSKEVVSEYEKMVKRGIDAFKNVVIENMQISSPDLYGNVLIEYVMDYEDIQIFRLFHQATVKLVESSYHKSLLIYTRLIWFILTHNVENVEKHMDIFVSEFGSLAVLDKKYANKIWELLNQEKYQHLIKKIFLEKVVTKKKIFLSVEVPYKMKYLSKKQWIEIIAENKLTTILRTIISHYSFTTNYMMIMRIFLKFQFVDGLKYYLNNFSAIPSTIDKIVAGTQQILFEMVQSDNKECFQLALDKELFVDINMFIVKLINEDYTFYYKYCMNKFEKLINWKMLGEAAVKNKNSTLLKELVPLFNQNELDYLLSIVHPTDIKTIGFLIEKGAKFEIGYYNDQTLNKVNNIIRILIERNTSCNL